ncbi:alcohol acetyltransferase [Mycena rebaudengoi]|nr:alcohol acetyltransferase [Mycena rebaudengoi]
MSSTHLRPVGLFERFHSTRHFLGLDSCVVLSAQYIHTEGSTLDQEIVFSVLSKVIGAHPALGVRLDGETTSKPFFARLETIDLSAVVQFSETARLEDALKRQLAQRFDTSADLPLWRVEVLKDNTVILALHHAIGDGLSGVAFLSSFLEALQEAQPSGTSTSVTIPETLAMLPPLEALTSLWPSWRKIFTEILALFAPTSWMPSGSAWTANSVSNLTPALNPCIRLLAFSATDMKAFLAACRSHSATVTSTFYVLAVAALSHCLDASPDVSHYKTLSTHVAVSLRTVAAAPATAMGDYNSSHHAYPPRAAEFSWADATRYAAELQRQKYVSREEVGMLYFLFGNVTGWMKGRLGKKRGSTFELSNAGRVAAQVGLGPWSIGAMAFAQCDVVIGSAVKMNAIGDPTGAVHVTVTWGEANIDRTFVESFIARFQEGFRALLV